MVCLSEWFVFICFFFELYSLFIYLLWLCLGRFYTIFIEIFQFSQWLHVCALCCVYIWMRMRVINFLLSCGFFSLINIFYADNKFYCRFSFSLSLSLTLNCTHIVNIWCASSMNGAEIYNQLYAFLLLLSNQSGFCCGSQFIHKIFRITLFSFVCRAARVFPTANAFLWMKNICDTSWWRENTFQCQF